MSMIVCEDCRWPIYTKKETVYPQRKWWIIKPNEGWSRLFKPDKIVSKGFMGYKCKQCEGE